jgi:hypothetical protein
MHRKIHVKTRGGASGVGVSAAAEETGAEGMCREEKNQACVEKK